MLEGAAVESGPAASDPSIDVETVVNVAAIDTNNGGGEKVLEVGWTVVVSVSGNDTYNGGSEEVLRVMVAAMVSVDRVSDNVSEIS